MDRFQWRVKKNNRRRNFCILHTTEIISYVKYLRSFILSTSIIFCNWVYFAKYQFLMCEITWSNLCTIYFFIDSEIINWFWNFVEISSSFQRILTLSLTNTGWRTKVDSIRFISILISNFRDSLHPQQFLGDIANCYFVVFPKIFESIHYFKKGL